MIRFTSCQKSVKRELTKDIHCKVSSKISTHFFELSGQQTLWKQISGFYWFQGFSIYRCDDIAREKVTNQLLPFPLEFIASIVLGEEKLWRLLLTLSLFLSLSLYIYAQIDMHIHRQITNILHIYTHIYKTEIRDSWVRVSRETDFKSQIEKPWHNIEYHIYHLILHHILTNFKEKGK